MPDEKKPITMIQVFAVVIVLLTISAIVWAMGYGSEFLKEAAKVNGLIKFSSVIVVIAIVLITVFYLISGRSTREDSFVTRELLESIRKVTPMQWVASTIGLCTIGGIIWVIASGDDILQNAEKTRGLITFSVAIVTVAIALIMVFYLVFGEGDKEQVKDRFTFGKDVLMVFVGILGTVMGFYYGAENLSKEQIDSIANVVQKPAGSQDLEQKALDLLVKKDFDGAVKAFDDAFNATPALPNIGNIGGIRKILSDNSSAFKNATDDAAKKEIWRNVFLEIFTKKLTVGMTGDQKKTVEDYSKPPTTPSPTATVTTSPIPTATP